jgi:tripartite-type tricarboxylate transporter receptor subunit TctC
MRRLPHGFGAILAQCLLAAASLAVAASPASADPVAEFYRGKTLTIVVGHEVGTGFDVYARVLQRHLRRHIPGNPNTIVQNMFGVGGVTAANWLYNTAARDGTTIGSFVYTVPFEPLMGHSAARYEPAKFNWIGNMEEGVAVCGLSKAAGVRTFDEMRTTETVIGGATLTGALMRNAIALRNLLGAKMKLVGGYKGTASLKIAIARGEVHGICGMLMSTITSAWRDDYEAGNFFPVIQLSGHTRLNGMPHVDDYAKSDDDRQIYGLIFGAQALGKLYAAPPGVPTDRRDALRAALMATMQDPEFVADAAKTQIDISPMTGKDVETFIARLTAASPAVVERVKQAVTP